MISLRTALCLSGLLVIATGSAALHTPTENGGGAELQTHADDRGDRANATHVAPTPAKRSVAAESDEAREEAETKLAPAP